MCSTHMVLYRLIDDEDTKAKVCAASPIKWRVVFLCGIAAKLTCLASLTAKVRPPSPGTPEYEQLEPITFAKSV
jgi:hypothetical protein